MGRKFNFFMFFLFFTGLTFAQDGEITIHSVSVDRQIGGETGYTLNGSQMLDSSRPKLLNSANFGDQGTYPKSITIQDLYASSGDLENIFSFEDIDLFYFGTFNIPDFANNEFTAEEIDSFYDWSINGGKVIIAASSSAPDVGIDFRVLNSKWNFTIGGILGPAEPTQNNPTTEGSDLFNGPFGDVVSTVQGGFGQGFFETVPTDAVVLAVNQFDDPVIILDCTTLDLILADGDTHNILSGVSNGPDINNDQDRFWANTIAFMDQLEDPPFINQTNDELIIVDNYNSYQWNVDGNPIPDATSPNYMPIASGAYSVTVELDEGCILTSPTVDVMTTSVNEIEGLNAVSLVPNPATDYTFLTINTDRNMKIDIELVDLTGRRIKNIAKHLELFSGAQSIEIPVGDLPSGTYFVIMKTKEGTKRESLVIK